MSSQPQIRISADVSNVSKALDDIRAKAQQMAKPINGKAAIDTAQAKKSVDELQKAVDKLHETLQEAAGADLGADALQDLSNGFEEAVQQATELQQVVSAIGGKGATDLGKSVTETRNLIREMERARRLQAALRREGHDLTLGAAGDVEQEFQRRLSLGGPGARKLRRFGSLSGVMENWRDLAPLNEVDARRQHRQLLQSLGFTSMAPAGKPSPVVPAGAGGGVGGGPGGGGSSFWRNVLGVNGSSLASQGAGVASSISPMLGAGLRGGLIGLAAYGITRVAGAVHQKMRSAEDESIGYSDLGRQMGAASGDFEELRNAVRSATEGLGMAYAETAGLARRYVSDAAVGGMSAGALRSELAGGAGFSRSLGLDPSAGVGLFGVLRHNRVTSGDADNRRIALLLADAIGKAGVFSKADDVLSAVESFTQVATHSSFSPANVSGYVGGMTGLMGSLPGLDPSAAAGMLGKADAAIRSGGGPAARNFFLGMMMRAAPGMDATDLGFLSDGGAFGTASSAFGRGSAAYRMAQARGDKALMSKYDAFAKDDKTTNFDRIMAGLEGNSVGTQALKESVKGYFGYSDSEAAALIAARSRNGSISAAVDGFRRYGVNPATLAPTAARSLMTVEYGNHADRLKQASYLRGLTGADALSKADRARLDDAMATPGADDSRLKEALISLSATRSMEKDAGDQSRESLANIDNATADLATKLIPLTASIRDAVATVAKKFGFVDKFGHSQKARDTLDAALATMPASDRTARVNRLQAELDKVRKNPEDYTAEYMAQVEKQYADEYGMVPHAVAAGGNTAGPDVTRPIAANKADFLAKTRKGSEAAVKAINAEGYALKPEWLQAQMALETGWGANVLPGTNNIGNIKADRNWKGRTATFNVREFDRVTGKEKFIPQQFKVYDSLEQGIADYGQLLRTRGQYLPVREARTAEQFASTVGRSGYATDPLYGPKMLSTIRSMPSQMPRDPTVPMGLSRVPGDPFGMMPIPANGHRWAAPPAATPQSLQIHGTFNLKDPANGRQLADPLLFSHMAMPQPFGGQQ